MADESDLEKTEPASPRRLEKAREEGNIPRSRELATVSMLLAAGCGVWFTADSTMREIMAMLTHGLSFDRAQAFDFNYLVTRGSGAILDVLISFAPLAGLLLLVAIASPVLIGGFLFSGSAFMPKFSRMNPLSGLMRMVSTHALAELGKAILKTIIVGAVAWFALSGKVAAMLDLANMPVTVASATIGQLMFSSFIAIVSGLILIAAFDAPYQIWQHSKKLMMTRDEVRRESRESDGNPEIKAKIRQQQRAMAKRRMMADVPTADVVVTNPTHFAVALRYADGKMGAPRVVAKGADEVAAKIREIAGEHRVTLLESPALARALYSHTEIGDEIPESLYTAVAEVLAYVFQLRAYRAGDGERPVEPAIDSVPEELDPQSAASLAKEAARHAGLNLPLSGPIPGPGAARNEARS